MTCDQPPLHLHGGHRYARDHAGRCLRRALWRKVRDKDDPRDEQVRRHLRVGGGERVARTLVGCAA